MKNKVFSQYGMLSLLALLGACTTTPHTAPIVERNGTTEQTTPTPVPQTQPDAVTPAKPLVHTGDEHGYYSVKKGDTLHRIALDNGQNYRDLVTWNNLVNPNDIKVDQVLRVLPPEDTAANANGVQLYAVPAPGTGRTASPTPGGQAAPLAASINKTGPRGEKKPYSEATLAEMQKPDAAAAAPVAATAPAALPAPPVAATPTAAGKPAEAAPAEENLTWIWPTEGKPVAAFEDAKKGLDISGKSGQQIVAAANGKIVFVGYMHDYGNMVIIKHTESLFAVYAHNKNNLVKENQMVTRGQPIAEMGDSESDAVKLHFEIRRQGKPVDPTKYLPQR